MEEQNYISVTTNSFYIKTKKLNDNAIIPTRGTDQAAGYDLYACIDEPVEIQPHCTAKIGTGLSMELPNGYFGAIFARSGMATKRGLALANGAAVIDSDFRGNIIVPLHNSSPVPQTVLPNERIAQLVLLPYNEMIFNVVDELSDTDRGEGGFGSTGMK
jgi:dUTP pyrophosphatase